MAVNYSRRRRQVRRKLAKLIPAFGIVAVLCWGAGLRANNLPQMVVAVVALLLAGALLAIVSLEL